jgi:hypothetical protein
MCGLVDQIFKIRSRSDEDFVLIESSPVVQKQML